MYAIVFVQLLLAMYLLIVLFLTSKSGNMKLSLIYVIYILSQRWIFIMVMAQVSKNEVNLCTRNPCETNLWVQTAPQCSLQFFLLFTVSGTQIVPSKFYLDF